MSSLTDPYTQEFQKRFHRTPAVFLAPGRINIIGEHVDYNGGLVLPAAVDRYFVIAVAPGSKGKCNVYAKDLDEGVSFSLHDLHPGEAWLNYLMGVIDAMLRHGLPIRGVDVVLGGNIPVGAGLSSSAALCCGFAFALNEIFGLQRNRQELALMAQYAEHEFAGVNCGIMDQYASLFGEEGAALFLDCRSLAHEAIPLGLTSHSLLLVDTKVKHTLAATAYNERRAACEEGVRIVRSKHRDVRLLRDVSQTMLYEFRDSMGEDVFTKCRFVVEEIERVRRATDALKRKDPNTLGALLNESHWGLSKLYEVSCEELDFLVTLAEDDRARVAGSRMMGGGFGGCTINLVTKGGEGIFKEKVRKEYSKTFGRQPEFYEVRAVGGVARG